MDGRLKDMAHFVIQHTPPERLGATKLNKVLWFADVMHFRLHGESISGATAYRKNHYGPVPDGIQRVLAELAREQAITDRPVETPVGVRREFLWLKPAKSEAFSPSEVDTLLQVIEWVQSMSARDISDLTHDALWDETPHGGEISVSAAAVQPCEPDEEDLAWAVDAFACADDAVRPSA